MSHLPTPTPTPKPTPKPNFQLPLRRLENVSEEKEPNLKVTWSKFRRGLFNVHSDHDDDDNDVNDARKIVSSPGSRFSSWSYTSILA